jgi:Tfp pilus tip-associated adhesin PilY1
VFDGTWTPIASCTPSATVVCQIDSAATFNYVTSYAPSCTSTVSGATWTSSGGNATDCQIAGAHNPTWTNTATCDAALPDVQCRVNASFVKAHSCTTTLSGTVWSGGASAVECNNTGALDGAWTNISTCTPSSDVDCQINASWLYRPYGGTCISTVSGATWTGDSNAADCRTIAFNPIWTNRATCDTTTPNAQCRINASFVKAHSCTTTLSGTNWTGDAAAVECNNTGVLDGVWSPISSCTPSGNVSCQVDPAPAWTYVTAYAPTCTSTVSGATWTANGLGNATECRTVAFNPAGWTARATCDTATPNVQCRVNASFVKAHSCTTALSGTNWSGGASAVECNNTGALDGTWDPIASCTPSSDVFCRINPTPAWTYVTAYAPTCTSTISGATWTSSGGNATECRTLGFNPAGWTNRATCDTATPSVQCRVNAGFVKADSCTTTLSGTNWTGGASAVECNNTGALDGVFTPTATCTPSSDIFCAVGGSTAAAFSYVPQGSPTCTSTVSGATWTSSGGIATDCSTAAGFSAWVATATCTESANLECRVGGLSAVTVGVEPTVPLDVSSAPCNAQTRSGSPGSYTYTGNAAANYCETVVTAPYVDVAYACTPDPIHDVTGFTTECQFRDPMAWANTASCVINASTDCRRIDTTGWVAANNCVVVATPDATGQTTDCRTTGATGFKLEQKGRVTSQIYSGPNQGGIPLGAATVNTDLIWSDAVPGTCFAAAPAVPATANVIGAGPPTPPEGCTSGLQVWPCETYSSGVGGVSSNVQGAVWTPPGDDPVADPSFATFTTVADHNFVEGHSVTIAGGTNSFFRGNFQIVEIPELSPGVPDLRRFKVLMADNPGATAHTGGTASLFAGSSNTLADVAQYYYKTDLRNASIANCTGSLGTPICEDNVPSTGSGNEDDRANWQHMTTFTMGLGLDGTLSSSPTYRSDQCVAKSVSSATWAANVVTVTTSTAHGFLLNQFVTVSGGANSAYRGQARITQVPSATTFRYALTTNPGVGLFGTGTATFCPDFVRLREGTINWPVPVADSPTALDDLWHAAVNGRGQYFSASDPDSVVSSLSEALAGISARVAAAAAAATSSLEPVAGDNFAYTAKYKTQAWTGDVEAFEIDLNTGDTIGSPIWSAQTKLNLVPKTDCDTRNIKLFRAGATDNMVDFKWNTLACDMTGAATGLPVTTLNLSEQAHFGAANVSLLSQFPNYGTGVGVTVDQRTPAAGANLVNYLRGQRGKEGFTSNPLTNTNLNKLYRTREHVLGDIVSAQPVFVKAPFAEYDDTGYATFKSVNHLRYPMVYAAANDGMLHALWAGTSITDVAGGSEMWAFIPTMVLPKLYKLASENYASEHTYSVDGTPVVGDVYNPDTSTWRTILVSGLNKGGKGYYALDITDPLAPVALWEFKHDASNCVTVDATTKAPATEESTDCHIGYTFNNPIISKLRAPDGRWVVFVTSGYNNVNSPPTAGDGMGYLYVLDAFTGKLLYKISTGVGSAADPSGLNHISAWSTNPLRNNTAERIYGGDLKGNIWRFDVNDSMNAAGREATLLGTAVDPSNVGQPITIRPELAEVGGDAYVYVATGRYLGTSDLSNLQTNSVLALRDTLGATGLADLRSNLRKLVITNQGTGTSQFRTIGCTANCSSADGWYADLPDSGERVNIDMKLQLGSLVVASNVPQSNACNVGGYAWINTFNNASGLAVANSADRAVGRRLVGAGGSESLAVGLNIVRLPSGKTVVLATTSSAQQLVVEAPFDVAPPTGKRVSWREIVQ